MAATGMDNKQFLLGGLIGFGTVTALGLFLVFQFSGQGTLLPEEQKVAQGTGEVRTTDPTKGRINPEPKVEPKTNPEPKVEPKTNPEPKTEAKPEPEPKTEPKTKVEVKQPEQRLAVPSEEEQAKAEKLVKTFFKEDYAKKKPADVEALAGKLLEKASENRDNMTERFVLLSEARELAVRVGNWNTALQAITELSKDFLVDALDLKAAALEKINQQPMVPLAARRELAQSALALVEEPLAEDRYPLAQRLLKVAEVSAQKASDAKLLAAVQAQAKKAAALGKEFEGIKQAMDRLKDAPQDAEANLLVGKFLCLAKGNWEKGLPLLALGSDAALKGAAQKDLANPADPAGQTEVGDRWWGLGEEQKLKPSSPLHRRAFFWYTRAFPKLTGLTKNQVEKRISLVPETDSEGEAAGLLRAFEPMPGPITGLAVSFDSRQIVAACDDGTMVLWTAEGKKLRSFDKHPGLGCVAFNPNGLFVAAGSSDHLVQLWGTQTGKILKRYTDYNLGPPTKKGKTFPRTIKGHFGAVDSLAFAADGRMLASGDKAGMVLLWDVNTAKRINYQQPYYHRAGVEGVAFPTNSRWLAAGTSAFRSTPAVFVWDTVSHAQVQRMEGHGAAVHSVAFTPNGKWLVSGSADNTVRLWDPVAGREVRRFLGHKEAVRSVAVAPDSRRALSASLDGTVRLWDLDSGTELFHFTAGKGGVDHVAFLNNGRRAVSAGQDKIVRLWALPR